MVSKIEINIFFCHIFEFLNFRRFIFNNPCPILGNQEEAEETEEDEDTETEDQGEETPDEKEEEVKVNKKLEVEKPKACCFLFALCVVYFCAE